MSMILWPYMKCYSLLFRLAQTLISTSTSIIFRESFKCKECKKIFSSHQALSGHRASHKKVKGCFAARPEIISPDAESSSMEDQNNNINLLEDPAFSFTKDSLQSIDRMLDYNVPGGKLNRGISVVDSFEVLKGSQLSDDEFFLAGVLGWCIEWLQAYFLVLDDIMDNSHTRRGQPCWFRVPKVGNIATNDGIILRNHIPRILNRHFKEKAYYVHLLDLFNEVEFQTASGQMLDLITTHEGEKDLSKYKMPVYNRIVQYKTAYYSFYLPVACALLIVGENLDDYADVKRVLVEMGTYFQVQDDYLDCFGDPEFIGKIGTDIEDFKCSWLVVQALEIADENQLKILEENYGKSDPSCVMKVKSLYKDLNLQEIFFEYDQTIYEQLISSIEAQPSKEVQEVLKSFLHKIYKRQK